MAERKPFKCPVCEGLREINYIRCPTCYGTGLVWDGDYNNNDGGSGTPAYVGIPWKCTPGWTRMSWSWS